jgi:carbon storage regulator
MLVLSRKVGERVMIGDSIWVTIVRVDGDRVRVGIEAPREVTVLRQELMQPAPGFQAGTSDRGPHGESAFLRAEERLAACS